MYLSNQLVQKLFESALYERSIADDFVNDEGISIDDEGLFRYRDKMGRNIMVESYEIIKGIIEIKAWNSDTNDLIHYFPIRYTQMYCTTCKAKSTFFIGSTHICLECLSIHMPIKVEIIEKHDSLAAVNFLSLKYEN
jgi:hypothetical protein